MGTPFDAFRLVRLDGTGCTHHLLLRAGRPSYPNADQRADDAANDLPDVLMDALTRWCLRWRPFPGCRSTEHRVEVLAELSDGVLEPDGAPVDLHADAGMRTVDIWVARNPRGEVVLGPLTDAATFWAAVAAEAPDVADLERPGHALTVLLLTDRSGSGDLRDVR